MSPNPPVPQTSPAYLSQQAQGTPKPTLHADVTISLPGARQTPPRAHGAAVLYATAVRSGADGAADRDGGAVMPPRPRAALTAGGGAGTADGAVAPPARPTGSRRGAPCVEARRVGDACEATASYRTFAGREGLAVGRRGAAGGVREPGLFRGVGCGGG